MRVRLVLALALALVLVLVSVLATCLKGLQPLVTTTANPQIEAILCQNEVWGGI